MKMIIPKEIVNGDNPRKDLYNEDRVEIKDRKAATLTNRVDRRFMSPNTSSKFERDYSIGKKSILDDFQQFKDGELQPPSSIYIEEDSISKYAMNKDK